MKSVKTIAVLSLFAFSALFMQACSSSMPNLGNIKEEVTEYYQSGKYEAELNNVIDKAIPEFDKIPVAENSIVVFDVDETVLSNYEYEQEVDYGYTADTWNSWLNSAKAPAIDGSKRLYDSLIKKGFKIAFVTGRPESFYNVTYKNLKSAGYTTFDTLITRNPSEKKLTALEYKSKKRVELTQKGYNIVGDVGDQYSDLEGPDHGIQIKIPNYMYIIK